MRDVSDIPDEKLHSGHRARMRHKLLTYGPRIFDTYELLEMVLYYAIPYKDTNPIAKRLLIEFGSLEGVLSASPEELTRVPGVGERAARLLSVVGGFPNTMWVDTCTEAAVYNDYDKAGRHMTEYFKGNKKRSVAVLLLDNAMRERGTVTVYEDVIYGSAGVKPAPFINQAILSGASVIITAHNRPYGPDAIIDSELETNKAIDQALDLVGITVAEHYVVMDDKYVGTKERRRYPIGAGTELDRFRQSRELAAMREEKEKNDRKNS